MTATAAGIATIGAIATTAEGSSARDAFAGPRGRLVQREVALQAQLLERHVLRGAEHRQRGEERELEIAALESQRQRGVARKGEVRLAPALRDVGVLEERSEERG